MEPRCDKIQEGAYLQRLLRVCGMHELHRQWRRRPVRHYRRQRSITDACRCLIRHHPRNSEPGDSPSNHSFRCIDRKTWGDRELVGCPFARETPIAIALQPFERDEVMTLEVSGRTRLAAPAEIVRAGAHHPPDLADSPRNQSAVRQTSDSHSDVYVVLDQIDDPIGQDEPDSDLRIGCKEFVNDWRHVQRAKRDRRCNQSDRAESRRERIPSNRRAG